MLIVAACLAPLCWFGSPADFWFVAVGALVSTCVGCVMVLVQVSFTVVMMVMIVMIVWITFWSDTSIFNAIIPLKK